MRRKIRKLVLLALLLFVLVLSATGLRAQEPPPPPPPANDYFPNKWGEYPNSGPFRIRFPKEPQERTATQGNLEVHYLEYKGLLRYSLSYVDYQTSLEDPQKLKDILQGLKAITLKSVQNMDHRLITEREVNLDNHYGLFVQIEVQAKEVIRLEWLVVGSRLYTISTLSRKATEQEFKGKDDYEEIALAFINSFRLVSTSAAKSNKSLDASCESRKFPFPSTVVSRFFRWAPDGQSLAFIASEKSASNIWLQSLDGTAPKQLTNFKDAQLKSFAWSRDGNWLAYTRRTATSDVELVSDFK